MSVYAGTSSTDLRICLESLAEQTLIPDEIVIVIDGPVAPEVRDCLTGTYDNLNLKFVEFEENRGLGPALRDGLLHCSHPLVARMDTDDVCGSGRMELQRDYLLEHPEISMVGGLLSETYLNGGKEVRVRRNIPEEPDAVSKFARLRNPANHPTVMFRKDHVLRAGNYVSFPLMEDYHLFARMLCNGLSLVNLQEVLVFTRPGDQFFDRRGGLAYLLQEIKLANEFRKMGFHTYWDSLVFILMRFPYRILPNKLRRWMYIRFLRS